MSVNPENDLARINEERDLHELFKMWETRYQSSSYDPEPIVRRYISQLLQIQAETLICFHFRLAEILEEQAAVYMRKDPDPFDERHPSRTDPESNLGKNLKLIFKKETFMNR